MVIAISFCNALTKERIFIRSFWIDEASKLYLYRLIFTISSYQII